MKTTQKENRHSKQTEMGTGERGAWANAWHPSWGDESSQPEVHMAAADRHRTKPDEPKTAPAT